MARYIQFQAFIGPKFQPEVATTAFSYWTSMPALDATLSLDYETAVATTLASGAVTLVTTNNSALYNNFPTSGGLWIAPNGASQGWEHIDYYARTTYTFSGITRESIVYREHNGVHTAGAEVRFWYPIESDNGELNYIEQLTPDYSARYWRMELGGFSLPPSLLRNDHMVAIGYRTTPNGTWKYLGMGISDSNQIKDDFQRLGQWVLHVTSLHGLAERTMIHGVHVGELNVAVFGKAFSSAPLGSAYKELLSGDYIAAAPDFSADSAIDGDMETLFISDYMVGTAVTPTRAGVTQLYLNPHLGRGPAYKWIELTDYSTDSTILTVYDPDTGLSYGLDFADFSVDSGNYRVILTDDPVTFARENPANQADVIIDVTGIGGYHTFLKHCNPLGGAMAVSTLSGYVNPIYWGNVNIATVEDPGVWDIGASQWYGTAIAAPGYGQTIAFDHEYVLVGTEDTKNQWNVLDYGTPGYAPRPDHPEDSWIAVYLPALGLVLQSDVLAAATSINLIDSSGEPSTEGLPNSGTLQIGSDQFTFTGKTASAITGCSGVLAHSAGDTVYVVENGIATDGFPIGFFNLRRAGGTIYMEDFYIRWSRVLARLPTQSDHEEDYNSPYGGNYHATTGSTADFLVTMDDLGSDTVRCRTVLIEFRKMTTEPACGRINELQALADTSYFSSDYYIAAPANAGAVLFQFWKSVGVPPGAITYGGTTLSLERAFRSAREWAWKAITDFADMHALFVNVKRDSEIVITDNSFYTTAVGGYTPTYTWDEDDVATVESVRRGGEGVGQVRLAWESPDGTSSGIEIYPPTLGLRGGIVDIGPYILADAADAQLQARKRYWSRLVPDYVVVELVDLNLGIEVGQKFQLSWLFPGETSPLNRLYIIAGVDIRIAQEKGVMVLTGLQIDREVQW